MYRWCAKHCRLVMFLWTVPVCTVFDAVFIYLQFPAWVIVLFSLFMIFCGWGFANSFARQLLLRAEKAINEQCDPYPLLNEVEDQLTYARSQEYRQILLIDFCSALDEIGDYQQALDCMESINIDQYPGTLAPIKIIYYLNLSDLYLCFGSLDKSEIWRNKALQMLNALKSEKHKQDILPILIQLDAQIAYCKKNFDQSIPLLNQLPEKNLRQSVAKALWYARNYLAQNRVQEAIPKLRYVIANGNRLADVTIAKDLLSSVEIL